MKGIYLDNYRGFSKEFIPMQNVNFLVGENSTGKTSFLAAIKILGSPKFWFSPSFDDPDLPFSNFSEIVSKGTNNSRYFSIGYFSNEYRTGSEATEVKSVLRIIRFKNHNGMPVVHRYAFLCSLGLVITSISDSVMSYKIIEEYPSCHIKLANICNEELSATNLKGYKRITNSAFSRSMFFANAAQFVEADVAGHLKKRTSFSFNFEMDGPSCKWIAPIRAKPEKIYLGNIPDYSAEGGHIPYLLNKILNGKPTKSEKKAIDLAVEFGKNSGLFESIKIKKYGKEALAPFEIDVEIDGKPLMLGNVGYGVSQVLPIIIESTRRQHAYTAIQQPEVHLHPKAQAALGEYIFECATEHKAQFLIETHSDFIIDRFRLCINKTKHDIEAQVLFFERTPEKNRVHSLEIDKNGRYPEEQPDAFRSFFLNEELSMLRV